LIIKIAPEQAGQRIIEIWNGRGQIGKQENLRRALK